MRKLVTLLIMSMLLTLPLAGCEDFTEAPVVTSGYYDSMSEEDAMVRRAADQAVMEQYGLTDLSFFEIAIFKDDGLYESKYLVNYTLKIRDYESSERYSVYLAEDFTAIHFDSSNPGLYSRYLEYVTEEAVEAADAKLKERTKGYSDPFYSLGVDVYGNLCLSCEVCIRPVPTEAYHHLFITEIICPKP